MDIVLQTNRGFTLLEMLLVMCILISLSVISLSRNSDLELEHLYYLNDYLYEQSNAMTKRTNTAFSKGISFNSMGHVNRAMTIEFKRHSVVVHLGNGYATIR